MHESNVDDVMGPSGAETGQRIDRKERKLSRKDRVVQDRDPVRSNSFCSVKTLR